MDRKPLVSVIIGFLNSEKFIQEAIESVFAQNYDHWELLLVDDGSTDGSTVIAKGYAKQYPGKVYYLEHEGHKNRGVCASRNLGIHHSKGEYIALLDSDDEWLPHKLEQQLAIMESYSEAGMVYGSSQFWHSWTGNAQDRDRDYKPELGIQSDTLHKPPQLLTLLYPLGKGAAPCPSDLLIRRSVVEIVGGFEESWTGKYQLYEDQAFLTKIYLKVPVYASSECWIRYRIHPDSCMSRVVNAGEYDLVRKFFLNWLNNYLHIQGVENKEIRFYLDEALRMYRHPILNHLIKFINIVIEKKNQFSKCVSLKATLCDTKLSFQNYENNNQETPKGKIRFSSLWRVTPISRDWSLARNLPVDRYYIEKFLETYSEDIKGHVLEIGDNSYTRRFGGKRVIKSDVLTIIHGNEQATIVGDLSIGDNIPSDNFDCIILTQTLQYIFDFRAAIKTVFRILKPRGVLLATFPGISPVGRDFEDFHQCWNFTTISAEKAFKEFFSPDHLRIKAFGNVLAAISFLHGLAVQELSKEELEYSDPSYELLITVRAVKH